MGNTGSTTHAQDSTTSQAPAVSVTGLLELIDWTGLPAGTQQTIRTVGPLMQEGCSRAEMAQKLGWPESRVNSAVAEIRAAILDQCERMIDDLEPRLAQLVTSLRT